MKKKEIIRKYGKGIYKKRLQQNRDRHAQHREEHNAKVKVWRERNPKKVITSHRKQCRKGGKQYVHKREYNSTGLQGDRNKVRDRHGNQYRSYKRIIAPESQLHHQWCLNTSNYDAIALVEKDQHLHGYIDVIQILEGEITLFTEEEIRRGYK